MKTITAIHFKHPGVSGLRCFQTTDAAIQGGEIPASLHAVGGILVKWPTALGVPPDNATVATWEAEYDAFLATADSDIDSGRMSKRDKAILIAAALLAGVPPAQAKAQAKLRFQQAWNALP